IPDLDAQVECSLICTTLSACDEDFIDHYTALSYVWGNAKLKKIILVEGLAFDVTLNLDVALRHMRDHERKRLIWADAICINQSDTAERNQQVAQMGKVYQGARHTTIFLGEATPDSDLIIDALRDEHLTHNFDKRLPWDSMYDRPWFFRVWVFQELMLSRDPWIQCGKKCVRWRQLFQAVGTNVDPFSSFWSSVVHMSEERRRISAYTWKQLLHCHSPYQDGTDALSALEGFDIALLSTLEARRGFGLLDPRDMLFAHRSCLGTGLPDWQLHELLDVDYEKTCARVYTDVAKYLVTTPSFKASPLKLL
ncbi:HET-domain-containing protein, partial [Mollisia scopiformis]